ncbi:hypothetical protein Esti_005937 [Eimeria stiedai]
MANLLLSVAARGAGLGASAFGGVISSLFSSATGSCLASIKEFFICPHPTECGCIGAVSYCLGCQDHRKFNLILEIHELDRLQKGGSVYLEASLSNAFFRRIRCVEGKRGDIPVTGASAEVEERIFLKIRQVDNIVQLKLVKKGALKTQVIADCGIRVKQDLIERKFPKREWITMNAVKGVSNVKALLSFHYMDPSLPTAQSPLLQQAVLLAQQEAEAKKEPLNLDLASMGEKQRLVFFSKVLEGPLQRMAASGTAWTDLYFKAVETAKDRWEWCCWTSRQACYNDAAVVASYPFLAISLVLPDKSDSNVFYVRYHEKYKQHDLFFKRVDRSRDLWSDGLFEFIDKLRAYLDLCATATDDVLRMKLNNKKPKKSKRKPSGSPRPTVDPSASGEGADAASKSSRRLTSPRTNGLRSARRPSSTAAILDNLMYTTQSDGDTPDEQETL